MCRRGYRGLEFIRCRRAAEGLLERRGKIGQVNGRVRQERQRGGGPGLAAVAEDESGEDDGRGVRREEVIAVDTGHERQGKEPEGLHGRRLYQPGYRLR